MALWLQCHSFSYGSPARIAWPDGGATIDQPVVTVEMFEIIASEFMKEAED